MAISLPLDWLRGLQNGRLPDAATIRRSVETSTADGVGQVWTDVATDVPCRVETLFSRATENAATAAARVEALSYWRIWLPYLTDVTVKDRIVVTGADRPDGRQFEVNAVHEKSFETVRALDCALLS